MKRFFLFSLIIAWVITLAAQQNKTAFSTTPEKLFVKHVNLATNKTEIWEVKSDNAELLISDFIKGTAGETPIAIIDEKGLKSLDLSQRIDKNPDFPENTILVCDNKIDKLMYSGTLIRSRHLLVTGKVFYSAAQSPEKIFVTSFDYLKKLNGYDFAYATDIYFFSTDPADFQNDVALITLDRPLGAVLGWMGFGYTTNDNYYKQNTFNITKLDYFTYNTYEMHKYTAMADMVQENSLYYKVNENKLTQNFTSGAPVYINEIIHGVASHWARTYQNGDTTYYIGTSRITPQKFNTIISIIEAATPTEPELIPLQIKVAPHKTNVLDPLNEISYRLFNESSATFNGFVKLDMYLSTDNLIDTTDVKITSIGGNISMGPNYFVTSSTAKDLYLPLSLKPGKYYMGAILTADDSNLENNIAAGVDCDTLWVENNFANNYISGKIITSGEYSGEGYCLLMQYNENKLGRLYDIVEVDENLNFEFKNIFLGKYIIVYVPSKSYNLYTPPTYYNQTPYWDKATVLELGLSDTLRNVNIDRIELPTLNGNKTISGNLSLEKTKSVKIGNEGFFDDVSVIVENQQDKLIFGYCNPDSLGFYQINNLLAGSYDILIDKPGYTLKTKHSITISSETEGIGDLNFLFKPDSTISATSITKAPLSLNENTSLIIYPNPSNGHFTIKLGIENIGDNEISIVNLNGEVISRTFLRHPSDILSQFDLEVTNGVYFIRIKNNGRMDTKKIIVM